jgi:hypothetical protein
MSLRDDDADYHDYAELLQLRADLARVTAERDAALALLRESATKCDMCDEIATYANGDGFRCERDLDPDLYPWHPYDLGCRIATFLAAGRDA